MKDTIEMVLRILIPIPIWLGVIHYAKKSATTTERLHWIRFMKEHSEMSCKVALDFLMEPRRPS